MLAVEEVSMARQYTEKIGEQERKLEDYLTQLNRMKSKTKSLEGIDHENKQTLGDLLLLDTTGVQMSPDNRPRSLSPRWKDNKEPMDVISSSGEKEIFPQPERRRSDDGPSVRWNDSILDEEELLEELRVCEECIADCEVLLDHLNDKDKEEQELGRPRTVKELESEKNLVENFLLWITESPSRQDPTASGSSVVMNGGTIGSLGRRHHVGMGAYAVKGFAAELSNPKFFFGPGTKISLMNIDVKVLSF